MEENNENTQTTASNENDDKVIGILSYLGILWVIAYIMYGNKKTDYNLFHLRQGLGLFIISIVIMIISRMPFLSWLYYILLIALLIFVVIGIINAASSEKKELPFIGKFISENLKSFK